MVEDESGAGRSGSADSQLHRRLPDGTDDVAVLMREEGRLTVDRLNRGLGDIDTKASKLMRTNLVLVGLLLSAFSFASKTRSIEASPFLNSFTVAGMLALIGSTITAGITYTSTESRVGVSPEAIYGFIGSDLDPAEVESGLAKAYARWIAVNRRANVENAFFATGTTVLVIVAVVLVATGTMVGAYADLFVGVRQQALWLPVVFILGVIARLSGAYREYRKWQRYRDRAEGWRAAHGVVGEPARSRIENDYDQTDGQRYNHDGE